MDFQNAGGDDKSDKTIKSNRPMQLVTELSLLGR